jgi:hypothetical protein
MSASDFKRREQVMAAAKKKAKAQRPRNRAQRVEWLEWQVRMEKAVQSLNARAKQIDDLMWLISDTRIGRQDVQELWDVVMEHSKRLAKLEENNR